MVSFNTLVLPSASFLPSLFDDGYSSPSPLDPGSIESFIAWLRWSRSKFLKCCRDTLEWLSATRLLKLACSCDHRWFDVIGMDSDRGKRKRNYDARQIFAAHTHIHLKMRGSRFDKFGNYSHPCACGWWWEKILTGNQFGKGLRKHAAGTFLTIVEFMTKVKLMRWQWKYNWNFNYSRVLIRSLFFFAAHGSTKHDESLHGLCSAAATGRWSRPTQWWPLQPPQALRHERGRPSGRGRGRARRWRAAAATAATPAAATTTLPTAPPKWSRPNQWRRPRRKSWSTVTKCSGKIERINPDWPGPSTS